MDKRLKMHPLGYWEVSDRPSELELQEYYAKKYYQEGRGSYEISYSDEEVKYFEAKLEQRWHGLLRVLNKSDSSIPNKILDVGCGEGYALNFFRQKGWQIRGIDFSFAGVESKNPSCLEHLLTGDIFHLLEQEINSGNQYDVVWLQNVLEHVLDPINLLISIRKLLSNQGVAVVTVPNDCSVLQRAAMDSGHIDSAFWVLPPDHLSYFDLDGLRAIAKFTGWRVALTLGDFPIDWFLFHTDSNYVRNKATGKSAHLARVQIENLIHSQPITDCVDFWEAASRVGIGRNITAYLTKD